MKKSIICIIITAALAGFIFYMSAQSGVTSGNASFSLAERVSGIFGFSLDFHTVKLAEKILRKSAHFILYTLLGISVTCTVCLLKKESQKIWLISALIVALYAVSDEFHQLFVAGRSGEIRDILIDTAGGALGAGIVMIFRHLKNHFFSKNI